MKEFDVGTHAELEQRFLKSLPRNTKTEWKKLPDLSLTGPTIIAIDPAFFGSSFQSKLIDHMGSELKIPDQPTCKFFVHTFSLPDGSIYISAAKILFNDRPVTKTKPVKDSVPIDSACILIGTKSILLNAWKMGGDSNESEILVRQFEGKWGAPGMQARSAFEAAGIPLEQTEDDLYQFFGSLTDEEIRTANKIVAQSDGIATICVRHHSEVVLDKALEQSAIANVQDSKGNSCAHVFKPGIGDGTYFWDELLNGKERVGYYCPFMSGLGEP